MDGWTIRADSVTKRFGENDANREISLDVRPGEVHGLLEPNRAGKTTLVKQIIGLLKPTSGTLTLGPYDLVDDPDAARQLCSYLRQDADRLVQGRARDLACPGVRRVWAQCQTWLALGSGVGRGDRP